MKTVLIRIYQDKLWFNETLSLSLDKTNLPFNYFKFSTRPIYWLLEMKSYDKDEKKLSVIVLDFKATKIEDWIIQQPKADVLRLNFLHLDWGAFCQCLSYYQADAKELLPHDQRLQSASNIKYHDYQVTVPISKLKIGFGKVTFVKKFKWSPQEVTVEIVQPIMVPELDLVKSYFVKVLGKRTIDVDLNLKIVDGNVTVNKAASPDLMKIDNAAIYVIKSYKIEDFKHTLKGSFKNQILIDLQEEDSHDSFGNIDVFERDILFHVLEGEDIKNKAQLSFLADILLDNQKLLLTLEPQFGFVFVINGREMVHCVWELVDSHATYVWSFNTRSFGDAQLKALEQQFLLLAQHGRSHYRNNVVNTPDLFFNVVQHKRSDDPIIDHFGKWRIELEKYFV